MHYPASELVIDPVLIRKYDVSGPRYTSYPDGRPLRRGVRRGRSSRQWLAQAQHRRHQPAALRLRASALLRTICYYCALQQDRHHATTAESAKYITLPGAGAGAARAATWAPTARICQLHWGGGTPTFLVARRDERADGRARRALHARGRRRMLDRGRSAPRRAPGTLEFLAGLGFNRVSLGVQDFDPDGAEGGAPHPDRGASRAA